MKEVHIPALLNDPNIPDITVKEQKGHFSDHNFRAEKQNVPARRRVERFRFHTIWQTFLV